VSSAGALTGEGSIVEGFGPVAITDVP